MPLENGPEAWKDRVRLSLVAWARFILAVSEGTSFSRSHPSRLLSLDGARRVWVARGAASSSHTKGADVANALRTSIHGLLCGSGLSLSMGCGGGALDLALGEPSPSPSTDASEQPKQSEAAPTGASSEPSNPTVVDGAMAPGSSQGQASGGEASEEAPADDQAAGGTGSTQGDPAGEESPETTGGNDTEPNPPGDTPEEPPSQPPEVPVPPSDPGQLAGCDMFPADNPWNIDVSTYAVHANSDAYIDSIGRQTTLHADFGTEWQGAPIGIPITVSTGAPNLADVSFTYDDESDAGPYVIPEGALIEGGPSGSGDRHVLVLDSESCFLYELFNATPGGDGSWSADSGAIFDLSSNALRPERYTSADAAGLPIAPGLVRYDEVVVQGEIRHALRFTVSNSQSAYIHPATHAASSSSDSNRPPMGLRLRMKSSYDCSNSSSEVQVICTALKRFGMFVADNGSNWFVSGEPNANWDDGNLSDLGDIPGDAFEAVETGAIIQY